MTFNIRNTVLAFPVVLLISATIMMSSAPTMESEMAEPSEVLASSELVARGEYLVTAGNCASCHTTQDGEFMSGGLPFETPFGTIYSTNITPDPLTGIGSWTKIDFLNSLRHGVRPNGDHLYPAFPYNAYTKASDGDILAMFAYLKSIKPVNKKPRQNDLAFPFSFRPLMALWKLLYFQPGVFEARDGRSDEWNRGAYLVEALAHCSACHTPRNIVGAERADAHMGGGEFLDLVSPERYRPWSAPNLTATDRGLSLWSEQDLVDYLKTARNDILESFGPMNEVIINSTRYLEAKDVKAMVTYLKSLTAVPEQGAVAPNPEVMGRGRTIYNLHCGTCHLPTGGGDPDMAPRLDRGSLVVQDENPASMINAILYGPHLPSPPLQPKWREPMQQFQYLLDDEEVASAATFIRHSWGNASGLVTAEQVARQR